MNRRSDIIFFGTIIIALLLVLLIMLLGLPFPEWMQFWWFILVPIALSKALFPNSKFTDWLNGDAFKK